MTRQPRTHGQYIQPAAARLQSMAASLPATSRRIAQFVLDNVSEVVHMSVTELAEKTESSEGSVVGLAKTLGYTGFQQFKIALAQDLVAPVQFIHEDLEPGDHADTVVRKVFASHIQALQDTRASLDIPALVRAAEAIRRARRVEVYGIGSAASIAEDAGYRLMRIGVQARVLVDSHIQAIGASLTGPDVATLTISHSGSSQETLTATRLAREAGATTIVVTNYGKSPILAFADIVLFTVARETNFRTEAMTSRIGQLAVLDALIACLALEDYEASSAVLRRSFEILSLKRY
ncbi:MurR/RpiR family transcriptional regulator [Polymorphobacter fuscus]|uniref:SIS domain-containing protein n=1 Tax=Sandarakinorhabdus fusca TaxID=1439888 RepID=A0A7C9GR82_9SPHN|nr:MurR/RpiR family transcriptional regulator [Polymorphobacter fuscus]KAB7647665.1 MurR/RpiR family transcriptional regulator [Polymorphobacter fuscus]MQT16951.1 SIS domain-containing protein [Polymorphobacter fuscus]NJC09059.1 DNA-binding MurR/RpiR family transcriptional regulator [Polymorphobacter fuscus]